jgi:hypothetical protein
VNRLQKVIQSAIKTPAVSENFGMERIFCTPLAPTLYPSALKENGPLSNFFRKIFFRK